MSTILGFHNNNITGAAIIKDGKIVSAVNEERLDRIKNSSAFPLLSIQEVLREANLKKEDVEYVAVGGLRYKLPSVPEYMKRAFSTSPKYYRFLFGRMKHVWKMQTTFAKASSAYLKENFSDKETEHIEHHISHAASAHFTSGNDKNLVVTIDGWGDRLSNGAFWGNREKLEKIYSSSDLDSLGYFYGRITVALGFKPHRHEGKITGLAGFGKHNDELMNLMKRMGSFDRKTMSFRFRLSEDYLPSIDVDRGFIEKISRYKREDVAYAVQKWLEELVQQYVTALIEEQGSNHLALAGGTFGNVKLNKIIKEIAGVKSVFVHPNMGDGGLCLGSALQMHNQKIGYLNIKLDDVYFGPDFSDEEIESELKKMNADYEYLENIEYQVAELLSKNKVVARCAGRMEYGPRALGNRTIMYSTQDKTINDWLNKRLNRTEFMPFAPVTLMEFKDKCYLDTKGGEYAAKFMTICFDCTDWMKEASPGVVHVDGTARPQLIEKKDNPGYYKILDEYRKITGIPSLINTSFNMHEEPIVCSPNDAIRSFYEGGLDYLALGKFLVKGKAN